LRAGAGEAQPEIEAEAQLESHSKAPGVDPTRAPFSTSPAYFFFFFFFFIAIWTPCQRKGGG
jgi:hypothetical protein